VLRRSEGARRREDDDQEGSSSFAAIQDPSEGRHTRGLRSFTATGSVAYRGKSTNRQKNKNHKITPKYITEFIARSRRATSAGVNGDASNEALNAAESEVSRPKTRNAALEAAVARRHVPTSTASTSPTTTDAANTPHEAAHTLITSTSEEVSACTRLERAGASAVTAIALAESSGSESDCVVVPRRQSKHAAILGDSGSDLEAEAEIDPKSLASTPLWESKEVIGRMRTVDGTWLYLVEWVATWEPPANVPNLQIARYNRAENERVHNLVRPL